MKGILIINNVDEDNEYCTNVSIGIPPYDYQINISTNLNDSFEKIILKPYDFNESIDMSIDASLENIEYVKLLTTIKNNRVNYIKNIRDINFCYEPKEVAEFVKRNPELKKKRIIFYDYFNLDSKIKDDIIEAFGDDTSFIYMQISGNDSLITFREYKDTLDAINQRINDIKKYDFSPLEKIMYVYDMVRDKVYVEVDENEDKMLSRNLSSALLGNKIVCLGYANIFKTLIESLGIECRIVFLTKPNENNGHARNVIYVKDKKYGVDGVYYFDPTWDNKKNELDNNFLYSYKYFGLTKKEMDKIDNGIIIDDSFPHFSSDIVSEFEKCVEKYGFEGLSEQMIKSINYMSSLINGEVLIKKAGLRPGAPDFLKPKKEKIVEKLYSLIEYYDTSLSADILLKVLYNVRKRQYYSNSEKFPFGLKEFCKTVLISKWNFEGTFQENLFLTLSDNANDIGRIKISQTRRSAKENNIEQKIQQVKLAKTLRLIYEQKNN